MVKTDKAPYTGVAKQINYQAQQDGRGDGPSFVGTPIYAASNETRDPSFVPTRSRHSHSMVAGGFPEIS